MTVSVNCKMMQEEKMLSMHAMADDVMPDIEHMHHDMADMQADINDKSMSTHDMADCCDALCTCPTSSCSAGSFISNVYSSLEKSLTVNKVSYLEFMLTTPQITNLFKPPIFS